MTFETGESPSSSIAFKLKDGTLRQLLLCLAGLELRFQLFKLVLFRLFHLVDIRQRYRHGSK